MIKVGFYLKNGKSRITSIDAKFTLFNKQESFGTGLKVTSNQWSKSKQALKGKGETAVEINTRIEQIRTAVLNYIQHLKESKPLVEIRAELRAAIKNSAVPNDGGHYLVVNNQYIKIAYPDDADDYKETKKVEGFTALIHKFVSDNKALYSAGRINHYKALIGTLTKARLINIEPSKFTIDDFVTLRNYMLDEWYLNSYINAKIKLLKVILKSLDPFHNALRFNNISVPVADKVMVSIEELNQLRDFTDLTPAKSKTKDLFIFACLTGQRISDFRKLNKVSIINDTWKLRQGKGKAVISIPLSKEAKDILLKYDYKLPTVSNAKHNENIKALFKKARLNREFEYEEQSGNKTRLIVKPLYELVASHTARRIFVTHSLTNGVPLNIISKITRQTIQTLQKYDKTDDEMLKEYYQ